MEFNRQMYEELYRLREKYKEYGRKTKGKAPLVCSDDGLMGIAEMCPRKLADLEGVPGIGRVFIDTYGQQFIDIVNKYQSTEYEKTIGINTKAKETLKELEKKLVTINRKNRLLFMSKITSKYAYDLLSNDRINPLDIIFSKEKAFTICNLAYLNLEEGKRFKNLVALLREINKDLRDKGQNDLYVGYPYVIGRLPGENFDVRCPLALFPVVADRTST